MKKVLLLICIFFALTFLCNFSFKSINETNFFQKKNTIKDRFLLPEGFYRTKEDVNSFGEYLRNLPLKPINSSVLYFNGQQKVNNNVYEAVVNLPIGNKDLHQCADAVMRLRADYLFATKQFNKIQFNFTNGFTVAYSKWIQGYRIALKGNKTFWVKKAKPENNETVYWSFLEQIFQYAGTASLEKELKPVAINHMKIGDVFIKGGFPGHAVIVVDMAVNNKGNKIFMLAQSYMPAQEIQVLKNQNGNSVWYDVKSLKGKLETPEWDFTTNQLKQFVE